MSAAFSLPATRFQGQVTFYFQTLAVVTMKRTATSTHIAIAAFTIFAATAIATVTILLSQHSDLHLRGLYASEPILRVSTLQHSGMIRSLNADRSGKLFATTSWDRTVKIWATSNGGLLQTYYMPIAGEGGDVHTGRVYSAAFFPNKPLVAVAGYLASGEHSTDERIYLINHKTQKIDRIIENVPTIVTKLAVSPDGRYIAAGLKSGGLLVYNTTNWTIAIKDSDYGNSNGYKSDGEVYDLVFQDATTLISSSDDGGLRKYDLPSRMLSNKSFIEHAVLGELDYSPSTGKLLIGDQKNPTVRVADADSLDVELEIIPPDSVEAYRLWAVKWSPSGRSIFASGKAYSRIIHQDYPVVIRWNVANGQATFDSTQSSLKTPIWDDIIDFTVVSEDDVIASSTFSVEKLTFAGLTESNSRWSQPTGVADLRGANSTPTLATTHNGREIAIFLTHHQKWLIYDSSTSKSRLRPDLPSHFQSATLSRDFEEPLRSEVESRLRKPINPSRDWIRSVNQTPAAQLIGTRRAVLAYAMNGEFLWMNPTSDKVKVAVVSKDQSVAITGERNGIVTWFRLDDGEKLLSFLVDPVDPNDWVAWTPAGYFDSSSTGMYLVGFQINSGTDQLPTLFPTEKFHQKLYRPDIVQQTLKLNSANAAADRVKADHDPDRSYVKDNLVPRAVITEVARSDKSSGEVSIKYRIENSSQHPVERLVVLADERAIQFITDRSLLKLNKEHRIVVDLVENIARVSLTPITSEKKGLRGTWVATDSDDDEIDIFEEVDRTLYVLAVGINTFSGFGNNLRFAAKDASDLVAELTKQAGGYYRNVEVYKGGALTEENATASEVKRGLDWIAGHSGPNDTSFVYFATHGVSLAKDGQFSEDKPHGLFHIVTHDTILKDSISNSVSSLELSESVAKTLGRKFLFLDTCHSGAVDITAAFSQVDTHAEGGKIYAAANRFQKAVERPELRNGVFTEFVLRALRGEGQISHDQRLDDIELDYFLKTNVGRYTDHEQTPTSRSLSMSGIHIVTEVGF